MLNINTISGLAIPEKLRNIPDAPKKLWYRGTLPDPTVPTVAIVGTRKPTTYGRGTTTAIAEGLARRGVVIVSGMAHGVDGIAHQACLRVQGTTVAVLPSGVDTPYPSAHRGLADSILEQGGALISEFEPGTPAYQVNFLQRNRLVIGLADILVVTEATVRSGTMNTTSHALAQGKEVYVVPGNITSPLSAGCNALIATGATPITDIEAFIDSIAPKTASAMKKAYSPQEQVVLELLETGVSDGDELQQKAALRPLNICKLSLCSR